MAKARTKLQSDRLGKALRGRDILIPDIPGDPDPSPTAAEPAKEGREPVTIRLTPEAVKQMARARSELRFDHGVKVSQSELVEVALLRALDDLPKLAEAIRTTRT